LSQYRWIIIAPTTLNNASVVAGAPHTIQKPGAFFVLDNTGLV